MSPSGDSSRRYSDEEVQRLLRRAADLESQDASLPATREGPTLADLEAIAAEAGLDPILLRQAARELDSDGNRGVPETSTSSRLLGAPLALEVERVVRGVGLGALGSALFATLFPVAAMGGAFAIARTAFRVTVRSRIRTLNRLADDLAAGVEDGLEEFPLRLESRT
jgi:hypothetical protein